VLDWLYQPEHLARFAAATGYVPPTRAAVDEAAIQDQWSAHPQLRVAFDQLTNTPVDAATAGLMIGPSSERDSILFGACTQIMADGADIRATLNDASQLVNRVIAAYESERASRPTDRVTSTPSIASDAPPTSADASYLVNGVVACSSGATVVGVWVEADAGGSGWAERSNIDDKSQHFVFRLANGGRYQIKVGCGGSEAVWATTNSSDFGTSPEPTFSCHDARSDPLYSTCAQL
jgi:hypothetical protein